VIEEQIVTVGAHGLARVNGKLEELLSWDELEAARKALFFEFPAGFEDDPLLGPDGRP